MSTGFEILSVINSIALVAIIAAAIKFMSVARGLLRSFSGFGFPPTVVRDGNDADTADAK